MAGRKEIAKDGEKTRFSPQRQPEKNGRKPDPFKAALEELAQADGQFIVSQTELIGLFDIQEGADGQPLVTIRGEWARDANGQPDKRLALITVQLPDATAIVAQWFRDAKSRKDNIRTRSRETLFDRVLGKAVQPLANDKESPLISPNMDFSTLTLEEKKTMLQLATKAKKIDAE